MSENWLNEKGYTPVSSNYLLGDINGDCVVNLGDYAEMVGQLD